MPQSNRPGRRSPLPTLLASALLSALFVFAMTAVSLPGTAFASVAKEAACSVNLRTSASTSAGIKATLKTGTKVTVATSVTGSAWKATCNGKTISSKYWYRISAVNGKSAKSLYGVTYVYGALYLFRPVTSTGYTRYAACPAYLRTSPSTTAPSKAIIATDTKVFVATPVTGAAWSATCAGTATSGPYWYQISAVNGQSVQSLYGVSYVYAANGLFKTAVTVAPAPTPTPPSAAPPAATCGTSLQTLINSTPTGGTLNVPACLYRESVTVARPMTIDGTGATIDGRDPAGTPVRQRWLFVSASDVTVRGFTMRYTSGGYAVGGVETGLGVQRFVLENCDVSHAYVNIVLGATDSTIRNCSIHDATHLGSGSPPTARWGVHNQITGNRIYHNNRTGEPDPYVDAAASRPVGSIRSCSTATRSTTTARGVGSTGAASTRPSRTTRSTTATRPGSWTRRAPAPGSSATRRGRTASAHGAPGAGGRASSSRRRRTPRYGTTRSPGTGSASASSAKTAPTAQA